MANEGKVYWGSSTTVISHAASLAAAANTYTGMTGCTMLELDNTDKNYPYAQAVLEIPETFAAAPSAGAYVALYMNRNDIDGTADWLPVPVASDVKNAEYVGSFPIENTDENHRVAININIEGVRKANFFISNQTGQAISYSATPTTVKITPYSLGPT